MARKSIAGHFARMFAKCHKPTPLPVGAEFRSAHMVMSLKPFRKKGAV
jgi:hypothetical protein